MRLMIIPAQNCFSESCVICPTLFVILQLFVYCASLGSQTHDFSESEMLNPCRWAGLIYVH